jgi:hypothetical protein
MIFTCDVCEKEFEKKSGLLKHKSKKKKCTPGSGKNHKLIMHSCIYCGKGTSYRLDNHKAHESICGPKYNNIPMNVRNNIVGNDNNNLTAINGNNIVNNINVIINVPTNALIPYTHATELSEMSPGQVERIFNCDVHPHVGFFEIVHCNHEKPEYHNIYYIGGNIAKVYDGIDFVDRDSRRLSYYFLRKQRISMINYLQNPYKVVSNETAKKIYNIVISTQILGDSSPKECKIAAEELTRVQDLLATSIEKTKRICKGAYDNFIKNKTSNNTNFRNKMVKKVKAIPRQMIYKISHNNASSTNSSSDGIDYEIEKIECSRSRERKNNYDSSESTSISYDFTQSSDIECSSFEEISYSDHENSREFHCNIQKKTSLNRSTSLSDDIPIKPKEKHNKSKNRETAEDKSDITISENPEDIIIRPKEKCSKPKK